MPINSEFGLKLKEPKRLKYGGTAIPNRGSTGPIFNTKSHADIKKDLSKIRLIYFISFESKSDFHRRLEQKRNFGISNTIGIFSII